MRNLSRSRTCKNANEDPPFTSDPRLLVGIGPSTTASSNALVRTWKANSQRSLDSTALLHLLKEVGWPACPLFVF